MKIHNEYLWLALIVIVLIVGPLASIWALNTLETWAAMLLVGGMFRSSFSTK